MSPLSTDRIGHVLGGRYRLLAPLGVGASARVYLAEDTQLQRQVAVKVLHDGLAADPVVRRRFSTESRAAAGVNHPHLLAVYDVGDDDGPFLVTEYLAGGSLRSLLDRVGTISASQALLVGLEAARGLEHAHGAGLIHRDIKPANLLFGEDGRLRIADFGLAKVLAEAALTEPSASPLGTARYASPEQARGDAVSPATDIYSLALVLVEAVTGTTPFTADHPIGGLVSRTERGLEVPAELGPLRPVLERAGRLDPAQRPDARELAADLLAAASELPRPAPLPLAVGSPVEGTRFAAVPERADDVTRVDQTAIIPATAATGSVPAAPATALAAPAAPTTVPHAAPSSFYDQATDEPGPARRRSRRGLALTLVALLVIAVAAGGAFAWYRSRPVTHPVPPLVGLQRDDIDRLVEGMGWDVQIEETRVDGTEPDEIVGQDPEAGVDLEEGERLTVTVSLGPTLVPVPADLVGRPLSEATAALEAVELSVGRVSRRFHEEIPADHVLALGPVATERAELPKGTAVALAVSDGPAPREIPDLAGADREDAIATLEGLGLVVEEEPRADRDAPEGEVLGTQPGVGATVPKGGTIVLVVSSGLPMVEVPDVEGMDVDDATDAIEAAGLVVGGVQGPPNRDVVSTDPAAGELVREGTEVTLSTRRPPGNDDEDDE